MDLKEVQLYRDTSKMTKEELVLYLSKPYKTKDGIIVKSSYKENGESIGVLMGEYLKKQLNKLS